MAYTEAQWTKLQSAAPRDERVSYADYLASLPAAERRSLLESAISVLTTADEKTKAAGKKTDTAAQKAAVAAAEQVISNFKQSEINSVVKTTQPVSTSDIKLSTQVTPATTLSVSGTKLGIDDPGYYTTRVGDTGLTSAQIDAQANAKETATQIGGIVTPGGQVTKPGPQPGAGWVLSADGKTWVKPPQPNPTDTWDDEKGWVPAVKKTEGDGPGKQPGTAWVLSADGKSWVQPPKPTDGKTYTWDDNKGWVASVTPPGGDNGTPVKPVGTPDAFIWDPVSKTWVMPPMPKEQGPWVFDPNKGWVKSIVEPGSGGENAESKRTLALDTFRNTLALLFGAKEASQPWVTALFDSASKFYNTGSTIDEAINLSLQDVRYNKDLKAFTDRFKGIYALTDRLAKGEAIEVPTVAEYFKSESAMGDVLRAAGMGDLATQDFLGDVIGRGKSVLEVTNLITDTFDRIDNAPSALKADLQAYFPGADRTSIAKAMLTGEKGAAELTKKVKAISVQSAAKTQGITINDLTSEDIAGQGYDYNQSLTNFATVKQLERGKTLGKMSGIDLTQQEAIASTFQANAAAAEKIRKIKEEEQNRFAGASGKLASRSRAQGVI